MNTVYLVRHGENPANITREFSHRRVDYPLTTRGVAQARQTAAYLREQPITAVYSSPLRRAQQTADIIAAALHLPVTVLEAFRETNVGVLEDQPPTPAAWEFHDGILAGWSAGRRDLAFPGGEDYHTLLARMRAGLAAVLRGRDGAHALIVGHGGIFSATISDLCANARNFAWFGQNWPNCGISVLELAPGDELAPTPRGHLRRWLDAAHLHVPD
ncbi:MAG: histidine phosphatase family protein [Ktedonobacterales bacterium]